MTDEKLKEINDSIINLHSWIHLNNATVHRIKRHAEKVAKQYAEYVVESLLLASNSFRLNGIGEVKQITEYNITDTDHSVKDVMQMAIDEKSQHNIEEN